MKFLEGFLVVSSLTSVFWADFVRAQSSEEEIREENFLEAVLTSSDDVPEMFEKIDLNEASREELLSIPGVSEVFVSSILEFRKRVKVIYSVDELSHLNGATTAALAAVRQRGHISGEYGIHAEATSFSSASPQVLPLYKDAYNENGVRNFQRLDLKLRNYEFCAVTDKDPGEKNYLDFYSLAGAVKYVSIFSSINIGNYRLSMGNGMLFSSGGVVSKSAEAITPLFNKNPYSLKLYRSRGETRYLRGAAFEIPVGKFGLTGFVSSKKFKAHLDSTGSVTSIDYSGLNLPTGGPSGGKLHETIEGVIIRYGSDWGLCGISGVYMSYDRPFTNYYADKRIVTDMFLRAHADRLAFSGEIMADKCLSFSANAGIDYERARFAVGLRELRSRVVSNYGGALSEAFPSSPEEGAYVGGWLRPADLMKLSFYYDRFKIKSVSGEPDRNGEEIFADCYLTLSKLGLFDDIGTIVYVRYKYKTREDYYIPESDFPVSQSSLAGSKQSFRIDLRHSFSRVVSVRTRLEKNFLSSGGTGELFVFDCAVKTSLLSVSQRVSFYRTDSYNSAFYVVEGDLPGVAMYTLLYGDGARLSFSASWKATDFFSAGAKISRDIYDGEKDIAVESSSRRLAGVTTISLELSCVVD